MGLNSQITRHAGMVQWFRRLRWYRTVLTNIHTDSCAWFVINSRKFSSPLKNCFRKGCFPPRWKTIHHFLLCRCTGRFPNSFPHGCFIKRCWWSSEDWSSILFELVPLGGWRSTTYTCRSNWSRSGQLCTGSQLACVDNVKFMNSKLRPGIVPWNIILKILSCLASWFNFHEQDTIQAIASHSLRSGICHWILGFKLPFLGMLEDVSWHSRPNTTVHPFSAGFSNDIRIGGPQFMVSSSAFMVAPHRRAKKLQCYYLKEDRVNRLPSLSGFSIVHLDAASGSLAWATGERRALDIASLLSNELHHH